MRIFRVFTAAVLAFAALSGAQLAQASPAHLTVYLVRHGQSVDNAFGLQSGWSAAPLTALGAKQADTIGKRLGSLNFAAAYSSGSVRAVQTLDAILLANSNPIQAVGDPRFREWGVGFYDQKPVSVAQAAEAKQLKTTVAKLGQFTDAQKFDALAAADPTKKTETWTRFKARILAGITAVASANARGAVVITSHGYVIKHLIKLLTGKYTTLSITNTSVTVLDYSGGKWTLKQGPTLTPKLPAALPTQ
ncbi:MAG: histidine phosphatase family protein [Rhodoluna sp.]|nr:histidine phosphatase family protein [Rhodoluna sp.]